MDARLDLLGITGLARAGRADGRPSKLRRTLGVSRAHGEVAEWLKALAC